MRVLDRCSQAPGLIEALLKPWAGRTKLSGAKFLAVVTARAHDRSLVQDPEARGQTETSRSASKLCLTGFMGRSNLEGLETMLMRVFPYPYRRIVFIFRTMFRKFLNHVQIDDDKKKK